MNKKKNWKEGKVVEYYREEEGEINFSAGELVKIHGEMNSDGDFHVVFVGVRGASSYFNKKYLREIRDCDKTISVEDDTVADNPKPASSAQSGNEDPRAELGRRLILMPETNKYITAANALVNRYIDGSIGLSDLKSDWIGLTIVGGVDPVVKRKSLKLILDRLIEVGEI